ncbi:MAG: hypothetical protein Kow009_01880 [Spirochaetales bacterium]
MPSDIDKAKEFLDRLLSNPMMQGYTPLQREEQILQLFSSHASQLAPILTSPEFFPDKSWTTILPVLIQALFELTDRDLWAVLNPFLENRLSLSFLSFLTKQPVSETQAKSKIVDLLKDILRSPEGRRVSTGPLTAIQQGGCFRYIDEIFERRSYIHFEITKVQRLRMSKEEIKGILAVSLLLKGTYVLFMAEGMHTYTDRIAGVIQGSFAEKVIRSLQKRAPLLPLPIFESAVRANMSFGDNRFIEATARLAGIFASRYRTYRTGLKVDRGADTPDKSWFNVARKNYKFYGFDIKMLDELYIIAAEMGW